MLLTYQKKISSRMEYSFRDKIFMTQYNPTNSVIVGTKGTYLLVVDWTETKNQIMASGSIFKVFLVGKPS
jgi:hypothetical protein